VLLALVGFVSVYVPRNADDLESWRGLKRIDAGGDNTHVVNSTDISQVESSQAAGNLGSWSRFVLKSA
jgi:hypothetical protein